MTLRVATDIGGTFTDLVGVDAETGEVRIAKVSTTPRDLPQGVLDVIAAGEVEPAAIDELVHGTTVVINALTERTGAAPRWSRPAGFRDVLEIGRGNRPTCTTSSRASRRRSCRGATASRCASGSTATARVLVALDPASRAGRAACRARRHRGRRRVPAALLRPPGARAGALRAAARAAARRGGDRLRRRSRGSGASTSARARRC